MSNTSLPPGMVQLGKPARASYFSISDYQGSEHHYRVLYIDDDEAKHQKEVLLLLPARTALVDVPGLISVQKPWLLVNTILTSIENLSLRNGLPVPL